jgi:hypothetical protein
MQLAQLVQANEKRLATVRCPYGNSSPATGSVYKTIICIKSLSLDREHGGRGSYSKGAPKTNAVGFSIPRMSILITPVNERINITMAKQRHHVPGLVDKLTEYAEKRGLDLHQYSPYHLRIMDGGYVVLDVWTTGRYYVLMTDYLEMLDGQYLERGGEKGTLPPNLCPFLDKLFFGEDMAPVSDVRHG